MKSHDEVLKQLVKLPDIKLVELVKKKNCSDAFSEIERRHEKLYFNICSSFSKKVPALKYEDIIQDSKFVLNRAVQSYNPDKKTKLSSWIGNYSRYHCLNTIRKSKPSQYEKPFENETIDIINNQNNRYHTDLKPEEEVNHVFHFLDSLQDHRISKIFRLRYMGDNEERKWKNIAKNLGISYQEAITLYQIGKKEVRKQTETHYGR